jgi:hypothetical protein
VTFNHGVEGSPSALTNEINNLEQNCSPGSANWEASQCLQMPIDDPATWPQGALASKSIFGLRFAILMVREARGSQNTDRGKEETKLIEAALDKASARNGDRRG